VGWFFFLLFLLRATAFFERIFSNQISVLFLSFFYSSPSLLFVAPALFGCHYSDGMKAVRRGSNFFSLLFFLLTKLVDFIFFILLWFAQTWNKKKQHFKISLFIQIYHG